MYIHVVCMLTQVMGCSRACHSGLSYMTARRIAIPIRFFNSNLIIPNPIRLIKTLSLIADCEAYPFYSFIFLMVVLEIPKKIYEYQLQGTARYTDNVGTMKEIPMEKKKNKHIIFFWCSTLSAKKISRYPLLK